MNRKTSSPNRTQKVLKTTGILIIGSLGLLVASTPARANYFSFCDGDPAIVDKGSLDVVINTFSMGQAGNPRFDAAKSVIEQWRRLAKLPTRLVGFSTGSSVVGGDWLDDMGIALRSSLDGNNGRTLYHHVNACFNPPGMGNYGEADSFVASDLDWTLLAPSAAYPYGPAGPGSARQTNQHEFNHKYGLADSSAFTSLNIFGNVRPAAPTGASVMPDDVFNVDFGYGKKNVKELTVSGQRDLGQSNVVTNHESLEMVCLGDTFTLPLTMLNLGSATISVGQSVYLSTSTSGNQSVAFWNLGSTNALYGVQTQQTWNLTMPTNVTPGSYHLFHKVDPGASHDEVDESNNQLRYSGQILVKNCNDSCQFMADYYGIKANQHFGWAPPEAQAWWMQNGCNKNSTTLISTQCQNAATLYTIKANVSFGNAPTNVQRWWQDNNCNKNPSCQGLSDTFGVEAWVGFGSAPQIAIDWWVATNCGTRPAIAQPVCQRAADRFAIVGGLSFGYAPSFISSWWQANNCTGSF
jgi:hypothetical protein